jgi:HAD superfamily hydrolase (TIGR01509 family)
MNPPSTGTARIVAAIVFDMDGLMILESMRQGVPAMPGLFEVLAEFRPKYKLAVATSAPLRYADLILSKLGIRDHFAVIQTSDEVVHGKPAPEIYLKAMTRLGTPPERCVVLEDSSNGALAGKRAGAYAIAVPSQYTRDQDFRFVDYIACDLLDAARHITATCGEELSREFSRRV